MIQTITKITQGLWHIEKFFPDNIWSEIYPQILATPSDEYKMRREPKRLRLEVFADNQQNPLHLKLLSFNDALRKQIEEVTGRKNLSIHRPIINFWRDTEGYQCWWHPDDYTQDPTIQIYVDGDSDQGTSFRIDDREFTLPFVPNSGYLMDNQYQYVHGMIVPVRDRIRQSIYYIF